MLVKGNHKIIFLILLLTACFAAKAQQERILLPIAYSLRDSVKLPEINKIFFTDLPEPLSPRQGWQVSPGIIKPDYFTRNWGIFCEGEWRMEKKTGIPIRFRLGSLDYVNRLEGKR